MRLVTSISLVVASINISLGQSTSLDPALESGRRALASGDYSQAIEILERVLENDDRSAEAHYLAAQAFLANGDRRSARTSIGKARLLDDSNVDYAVAELEIMRATTTRESSISLTDSRRVNLARQILDKDPASASALEELGIHHAMSYRWYANFDATKRPLGNSVRDKALEEFTRALSFLERALKSDPERLSAYAELLRLLIEEGRWNEATELAQAAVGRLPRLPEPWLFAGLVAQLQQQAERADTLFRRAIDLMTDVDQDVFLDVAVLLNESERSDRSLHPNGFAEAYWSARDPFRLTSVNERQTDHFARLAYTELWYGTGSVRGWETERGEIVLRYGIPWTDSKFIGGYSRFNLLEYRDFEFVFEDQTRGGHYTMYSPKAGVASSWTNDYVIQAGEMAISNPEQYDPKIVETVGLLAETSVFQGHDGTTDVYVHVFVPPSEREASEDVSRSGPVGVFAVDSTGEEIGRMTTRVDRDGLSGSQVTLALEGSELPSAIEVEFLSDDRSAAGTLTVRPDWPVFGGDSLALSDLLPAALIEDAAGMSGTKAGRMVRQGYSIAPMPWIQLEAGSELLVYFEIYGLELNATGKRAYRLNAILRPDEERGGVGGILSRLFKGSDPASVAASIESESAGADEARFISVELPAGASGSYQFELDVTDLNTGRHVRREHSLTIRPAGDH